MPWNEPQPLPEDFEAKRAAAKEAYQSLGPKDKLIADLRALSMGPGSAATINSIAADEIELLSAEVEGLRRNLDGRDDFIGEVGKWDDFLAWLKIRGHR